MPTGGRWALLLEVRNAFGGGTLVISGNLGPRGDGYQAAARMSAAEAEAYHAPQIRVFAETDADMVAAFTMTYAEEAIGIVRAARAAGMPVVISFTTETDGRLPSGEALDQAIARTDDATGGAPVYYMINCAHPTHLAGALERGGAWRERVRGLRANASRRSHAELDESPDLDAGDPDGAGAAVRRAAGRVPAAVGGGRVLRDGPPPRRGDRSRARTAGARGPTAGGLDLSGCRGWRRGRAGRWTRPARR